MTEIIKTNAIVLKKFDYQNTSKIATFYTYNYGKISAIIKGARLTKSQIGSVVDVLNEVQLVVYKKNTRSVQIVSQVELLQYFKNIKSDLEKLKYSSAVIELLNSLILENEINFKLYKGTIRILELMNSSTDKAEFLFIKYFLFFLKELGYQLSFDNCAVCGKKFKKGKKAFNYETGFICEICMKNSLYSVEFDEELFELIKDLTYKANKMPYNQNQLNEILYFLEKYLIYHNPEFTGIKSLRVF